MKIKRKEKYNKILIYYRVNSQGKIIWVDGEQQSGDNCHWEKKHYVMKLQLSVSLVAALVATVFAIPHSRREIRKFTNLFKCLFLDEVFQSVSAITFHNHYIISFKCIL